MNTDAPRHTGLSTAEISSQDFEKVINDHYSDARERDSWALTAIDMHNVPREDGGDMKTWVEKSIENILREEIVWGLTNHKKNGERKKAQDKIRARGLRGIIDSYGMSKEAIDRINRVYAQALRDMQEILFMNVPKGFIPEWGKEMWDDIEEFMDFIYGRDFLDENGNYTPKYAFRCQLLKMMIAVNDVLGSSEYEKLTEQMDDTIDQVKRMPGLRIITADHNENSLEFDNGGIYDPDHPKYVRAKIVFRTKNYESIVLKQLYNRNYRTIDAMTDLKAMRIEIGEGFDNPEKIEDMKRELVLYFGRYLFGQESHAQDQEFIPEGINLKVKGGFFTYEQATQVLSAHNENEQVKSVMQLEGSVKWATGDSFQNASLIWNVNGHDSSTEVQFSVVTQEGLNKNEAGFNRHEIYDIKKRLSALCRLRGFLNMRNIKIAMKVAAAETGIDDRALLHHMIYPQGRDAYDFPEHGGIPPGFIIPVNHNGHLRFVTRDIFSQDYANFYKDEISSFSYPPFQGIWKQFDDACTNYAVRDFVNKLLEQRRIRKEESQQKNTKPKKKK